MFVKEKDVKDFWKIKHYWKNIANLKDGCRWFSTDELSLKLTFFGINS